MGTTVFPRGFPDRGSPDIGGARLGAGDKAFVDGGIEHGFAFYGTVFPLHVAQDLSALGRQGHGQAALGLATSKFAANAAAKPSGFNTNTSQARWSNTPSAVLPISR